MFEEQDLTREGEAYAAHVPGSVADVALFDQEVTAFVEVAENSPSEANVFEERAIDACDPTPVRIDQENALHAGKDLFDSRRRFVCGIGKKFRRISSSPSLPRPGLPGSVPAYS